MELAILALFLAPSLLVFLVGCVLAVARTVRPQVRPPLRTRPRGRAA
jgi:hypothetical protein